MQACHYRDTIMTSITIGIIDDRVECSYDYNVATLRLERNIRNNSLYVHPNAHDAHMASLRRIVKKRHDKRKSRFFFHDLMSKSMSSESCMCFTDTSNKLARKWRV